MKNRWTIGIGTLLILLIIMTFSEPKVNVFAATRMGEYEGVHWEYDDGTFTITGEGEVPQFYFQQIKDFSSEVKTVRISEGFTNMRYSSFGWFNNVKDIYLPASLTWISEYALEYLDSYTNEQLIVHSKMNTCAEYVAELIGLEFISEGVHSPTIESGIIEGTNICWTLNEWGKLEIYGEGDIPNDRTLWSEYHEKIRYIEIAGGINKIGAWSFCGVGAAYLKICEGVKEIGDYSFENCNGLNRVDLPNSIEKIGNSAFGCTYASFTVPMKCYEIGNGALGGALRLKVAEGNTQFSVENGVLYELSNGIKTRLLKAEGNYEYGDKIIIPEGVAVIDSNAFFCAMTSVIVLPESLQVIRVGAFDHSYAKKIVFQSKSLLIQDGAFENSKIQSIELPVLENSFMYGGVGRSCFLKCDDLEQVIIKEGTEYIMDAAFAKCTSLSYVEIPSSVIYIADTAFQECDQDKLTLYVQKGSYAEGYALEKGIKFVYFVPEVVAPALITASAGVNSVTISWDAVPGAELYSLYLKRTNGETVLVNNRLMDTTCTINNLTSGTKVGFVVKAYGNGKWSGWSSTAWATPTAPVYTAVAPSTVTATAGNGSVNVTWSAVPGAKCYALFLKRTNGEVVLVHNRLTTTEFMIPNLPNGTTVGFVVKSYVGSTWSGWSSTAWATPIAPTTQYSAVAPSDVTTSAGNKTVTVTWDAVPGAQLYALYMKKADGTTVLVNSRLEGTTCTLNNLTNGERYGFIVKSYVAKTWSGWSATAWETPMLGK